METFLCFYYFTFFNVFKHELGTVEFSQNNLIDQVNWHGYIGTLLKQLRFRESALTKIWKRFFV